MIQVMLQQDSLRMYIFHILVRVCACFLIGIESKRLPFAAAILLSIATSCIAAGFEVGNILLCCLDP